MASTFTNLIYHIVYSTKYRHALIGPDFREDLYRYVGGIIRENHGIQLQIGGMSDHVHILAKLSPTIAIADVLRLIKSNSSKCVNEKFEQPGRFEWQTGYAAFTVSQSQIPVVARYIQTQEVHHRNTSFKDEFLKLLIRHQVEFDERYVFEVEHIA